MTETRYRYGESEIFAPYINLSQEDIAKRLTNRDLIVFAIDRMIMEFGAKYITLVRTYNDGVIIEGFCDGRNLSKTYTRNGVAKYIHDFCDYKVSP